MKVKTDCPHCLRFDETPLHKYVYYCWLGRFIIAEGRKFAGACVMERCPLLKSNEI
jgi:hypothetical protein